MSTPEARLLATDLDRAKKTALVRLCRDLGLPCGGLKATLESALRAKATALRAQPTHSNPGTTASTTTAPTVTTTTPHQPPIVTASSSAGSLPSTSASASGLQHHAHLQAIAQHAAQQAVAQALGAHQLPPVLPPTLHSLPLGLPTPLHTLPASAHAPYQTSAYANPQPLAHALTMPPTLPTPGAAPVPPPLGPTPYQPLPPPPIPPQALPPPSATQGSTLYQPPAASHTELQAWQAQLAAATPAHLATGIPPLPARLQARLIAGEFIDFADILHATEVNSQEEQPVSLEVGEGHHLTLSRKRKRRDISDFTTWSQCFTVYAAVLTSVQPSRGPDLFAYHYIIATASKEYSSSAFLAYDVAFRKKAAQYRLTRWGEIDPHIYSRAFTGMRRSSNQCSLCTSSIHRMEDCSLYTGGPARKPRTTPAGPKPRSTVPNYHGKEVCLNWNRGRCSREHDCPRAHVCSVQACQGPHRAFTCPSRRSSPRKA